MEDIAMAKVWLITGSVNGLGREIAEAVLAAGDSIVAGARRTEELAPYYGERVNPVGEGSLLHDVFLEAAATSASNSGRRGSLDHQYTKHHLHEGEKNLRE